MSYSELSKKELLKLVEMNNSILNSVPIGFCITDENGIFELVNKAYCKLYGYQKEELIGRHFSIVTTDENMDKLIELHDEFLIEGKEMQKEWLVKNKEGKKLVISACAAKIIGKDGKAKKVTYVLDISKQKKLEKQLQKMNLQLKERAIKDDLTGLYNYNEIMERLEEEINRSSHSNSALTVMMIDLDNFREVNNNYGHIVGDQVLKEIAAKIKESIRKMDIAGRIGGDEMVVIFPETTLNDAKLIAQRILTNVAKEKIAGIKSTFSAGLYEHQSEEPKELIEKADKLMYKAKDKNKNQIRF